MNWQAFIDPETSQRLCIALLHSLWQVALAAAVARVVARSWKNASVEWSYAVHVGALVLGLAALPATFWLASGEKAALVVAASSVRAGTKAVTHSPGEASYADAERGVGELPSAGAELVGGRVEETPEAKPQAGGRRGLAWGRVAPWIATAYAAGVAGMLLRLAAGVVGAERLRRAARPLVNGPAVAALERLARRWNVRVAPALAQAERIVVPTLVGLLKPTILLPAAALAGLSAGELEMILAHELAHVRRRDMWVNLLQRLAEVALFFNPALWHLSRRIAALREYCCDERACGASARPSAAARVDYAAALLRVVELAHPRSAVFSGIATLAASGRSPSDLRRRVARLLGEPLREPVGVSRGALVFAAGVVLAVVVAPGWGFSQTGAKAQAAEEAKLQASGEAGTGGAASALYPAPKTEADDIVAAARARTFGLKLVPRILIRQRITSGQVAGMTDLPERSIAKMFEAVGKEFDASEWSGSTDATVAWSMGQVMFRTTSGAGRDAHSQSRYWDGADGWITEASTQGRHVYRYPSLAALMENFASSSPLYFPQFSAAGGALSWGGPQVEMEDHSSRPELTRYMHMGIETVDGVECDVYDGPRRMERVWIAKSNGTVKAMSRNYVHDTLPNYYTELIREAAGRTFADDDEYRQWLVSEPMEVKERLSAHWSAAHWSGSKPGNLVVFSDYREVVSGVLWPMHCERMGVLPKGKTTYRYFRNAIDVTEVTETFKIEDAAREAAPHEGDNVTDRRTETVIDYAWSETLDAEDVDKVLKARQEQERQAAEAKRKINEQPIDSVADAIGILTDGPKTDPTMAWARAIKYLVDHKEEGLPAVIKRLDLEPRDHSMSKLAFALRAMGDPRAVPALIRALPRTLLPSRSDYGLALEEDAELLSFMQQHDLDEKELMRRGLFSYGRAFREVTGALHRLTDKDFGEGDLNWIYRAESPVQRQLQAAQFDRFARRWAAWWEAEGKSMVDDPAYAAVNLPEFAREGRSFAGRAEPPAGRGVALQEGRSGWIVEPAQLSQERCFVDLDTMRQGNWPESLGSVDEIGVDSPELLAWARAEGFDVMGVTHTPPGDAEPLFCLQPLDLRAWKMTPEQHRDLREAMAGRAAYPFAEPVMLMVPQREVKRPYDHQFGGDSFLFVTREGSAGVLRMTAQVTDVGGGGAYSLDDQFSASGFHRGAKVNFATMSEPEIAGDGP